MTRLDLACASLHTPCPTTDWLSWTYQRLARALGPQLWGEEESALGLQKSLQCESMDPGFLGPVQSPSAMGCLATILDYLVGWWENAGGLQPSGQVQFRGKRRMNTNSDGNDCSLCTLVPTLTTWTGSWLHFRLLP